MREWIMYDTKSASVLDRKTNKYCYRRKITANEVFSAIERIYPYHSILSIELYEVIDRIV